MSDVPLRFLGRREGKGQKQQQQPPLHASAAPAQPSRRLAPRPAGRPDEFPSSSTEVIGISILVDFLMQSKPPPPPAIHATLAVVLIYSRCLPSPLGVYRYNPANKSCPALTLQLSRPAQCVVDKPANIPPAPPNLLFNLKQDE